MASRRACYAHHSILRLHQPPHQTILKFASAATPLRTFSSFAFRRVAYSGQKLGSASRVSAPRHSGRPRSQAAALTAGVSLLFSLGISLFLTPRSAFDALYAGASSVPCADLDGQASPSSLDPADNRGQNLPRFRINEIRKHGANSENPWIMHGDKVYDITEWVPAHPGGRVILQAAGGSIDPYWDIFTIHKNQYVYDILEQYLIGFVDQADLVDGKPAHDQIEDPFEHDPERDPSLITHTAKPRNAEPPGEALGARFLTPNELFYVRNHMWVPNIRDHESDNHRLTIELVDGTVKVYTLEELREKFPKRKITAALQCSGNRRSHMSEASGRKANGLPWSAGAISNASWEGVYLADVLADAGFDLTEARNGLSEAQHVQFMGLEAYGASIPLRKAVDPFGDVLLAYSMNGKPLPRDHGFPLRAIVPGYVAARSVKWLNHITLSEEESASQWQRKDYKCFGPNQTRVDWDDAPAIQEMPVQSAITGLRLGKWIGSKIDSHALGNDVAGKQSRDDSLGREIYLSGYAFSGGGRSIIRVDVSLDDGLSWDQAILLPDCVSNNGEPSPCQGHGTWAWKRWQYAGLIPAAIFKEKLYNESALVKASSNEHHQNKAWTGQRCTNVLVKAVDDAYNTQPESHAATWNIRGNLATAWHRMQVCTAGSEQPQTSDETSQ
ncbi:Oxidoreductase, molybdopterin-binding domain protein [Moelleriella libera RCEF 2490]|uniref:Nitrate reductase [NADPH] n=1 Tax=Moelleriella libera RCEF 2490 TaxID=1081109 RepID=A0A167XBY3_9HYPO|nr:Oxidoreductase, molybdopterin-binding domain protein [Moelleriella libera RCEF 2490]